MKIVTIGGGTGQFALLKALRQINDIDITAIVSMVDSGGSTGRLRDEFGILPPGDVLKCLIALSPLTDARKILQARFKYNERLKNHNAGNLLLTFLSQYMSNDFPAAIDALGEILNIKGHVLPVTLDKATLAAQLENKGFVFGESQIDIYNDSQDNKIAKVFLVPHQGKIEVYPQVVEVIHEADYILVGPGDLYTSIIPNFLVPGVTEALGQAHASVIYIANIMTKYTETANFNLSDFVKEIEKYSGRNLDKIICNKQMPDESVLHAYKQEDAIPVGIDINDDNVKQYDLLSAGKLARHDTAKLQEAIKQSLNL